MTIDKQKQAKFDAIIQMQYFSKWRKEWIDFKNPPTQGDMYELKKYKYEIREKRN